MFAYLRDVFNSASSASFARWATAATVATGCYVVIHVVRFTHHLPDGGELVGLCAFMTAPYAISKVTAAMTSSPAAAPATPGQVDNLSAAATPHHETTLTYRRQG